jgi:methionyl-tRNA synthetase
VVGKGIIRFHAVYWPAMLLSAGIELPKKLFVHGYINIAGGKMSKSLGNVIDPFELIEKYGVEPVRYYLLRHVHPVLDSDFSSERFEESYNADLSNGLGNLVSRVAGLIEQNDVEIKLPAQEIEVDATLDGLLDGFAYDQSLKYIWDKISAVDGFIAEKTPWVLAKEGKKDELAEVLNKAVANILEINKMLTPFLPQTVEKIGAIFSAEKIKKGDPLFPRLAKTEIIS